MADHDAYADTDTEEVTEKETSTKKKKKKSHTPKLFRLSSRIVSLKRRGQFQEPKEQKIEFDFYADDRVTVRGPKAQFYVCRILEDVLEDTDLINIAWYDLVAPNKYKVAYDDTIFKASIITRIELKEDKENGYYFIPSRYLRETNKLLKESLQNEGIQVDWEDEEDSEDDLPLKRFKRKDIFDFPSDEDCESEPTSKKRKTNNSTNVTPKKAKRKSVSRKTPKKETNTKDKEVKKSQIKIHKGLIPNPEIKLLKCDPLFGEKNNIPLLVVKQGIQAVLLKDYKKLEELLKNVKGVYTVNWQRSPHIKYGPIHYALLNEDRQAIRLLFKYAERKNVTAQKPKVTLAKKDTGSYNFCTFGHAVREVTTSRGNKEGNNAFLRWDDEIYLNFSDFLDFSFKHNLSYDFIKWGFKTLAKVEDSTIYESMYRAIKNGHSELAGAFMKNAVEANAYGYNFLHEEVLCHTTQPLTKFKVTSITKKPYTSRTFYPLHCACINPHVSYVQKLFSVFPEYSMPDWEQSQPIHYAAACSGDGPLKYLLTRGVDPNSLDKSLSTPLIIAAKTGRTHNVKVLMELTITEDNVDDEVEDTEVQQIKVNAKNKKKMAALHYAAKRGYIDTVKALLECGATVDIQTGADKENMTPLGFAAQKGHYEVVKVLLDNKAAPDKKMRRNKTALMYACMNGHSQIVAHLLQIGVNPNAIDSSENTPIHYTVAYGWYHCVQLLLEGGADPSKANIWKTTPFSVALSKGHIEIGDLLLSADVDINYPDDLGRTIIMTEIMNHYDDNMLTLIKYLVEQKNGDVSKCDIKGWSALHYLASHSVYEKQWGQLGSVPTFSKVYSDINIQIARVLLQAGIDSNIVSNDGEVALMIAIKQMNYLLVDLLLENDADPCKGCTKEKFETCLDVALKNRQCMTDLSRFFSPEMEVDDNLSKEDLQQLYLKQSEDANTKLTENVLEHGCSVNYILKDGSSPLMLAISMKKFNVIEVLLKYEANPLLGKNEYGENILHIIARKCDQDGADKILQKLTAKINFSYDFINARDHNGMTPLLVGAMVYGNSANNDALQAQIGSFLNILIKECKADVGLTVGEESRNEKTLSYFNCGFQPDKRDEQRNKEFANYGSLGLFSVLHCFVIHSTQSGVLKEALKHCTPEMLNHRDRYGRTALHVGLHKLKEYSARNVTAINLLIKAGANVNMLSGDRYIDFLAPPLVLAIGHNDSVDVVCSLLKASADPNIADGVHGCTALSYAVRKESNLTVVNELLKAGSNVNALDNDGRSALHWAVNATSGGYETLIEIPDMLVEHGAAKDVIDKHGRLPLHYAFQKIEHEDDCSIVDPISIVKMLYEVEAEHLKSFGDGEVESVISKYVNHQDNNGRTALHLAALRGATISCLYLKKLKASDSVQDCDNNTPLALAVREKHHGCAMMLIQQGSSAKCDVTRKVTRQEIECYKKELKANIWRWGKDKPEKSVPVIKSAFQIAIKQNWQGLAYVMLDVAELPFIDAFKAGLAENKLQLLWTLLKKQKKMEVVLEKDSRAQNLLHMLAWYIKPQYVELVFKEKHQLEEDCSQGDEGDEEGSFTEENSLDNSCSDEEEEEEGSYIEENLGSKGDNNKINNCLEREEADNNKRNDCLEIGRLLLEHHVSPTDLDLIGASPLHYAAKQVNFELCKLLLNAAPDMLHVADENGFTPLVHVMHTMYLQVMHTKNDCTPNMVALIKYFVEKGAAVDICFKTISHISESHETSTFLIDVVTMNNPEHFGDIISNRVGALEFFLQSNADVNYCSKGGETALMRAVVLNNMKVVDILLKKQTNLDIQDSSGNSVIHYCVQTDEYQSYENANLLHKLIKAGASVNIKNKDGRTPLDLANNQMSRTMANVLKKHNAKTADESMGVDGNTEFGFIFNTKLHEFWKYGDIDVVKDSNAEIEKKINDVLKHKKDEKVKVDSALEMSENGEVYVDSKTNIPYDVILSKVDVRWGSFGLNIFYKLQVVYHKGKNLWILFNRWGRIGVGHTGQHQQTPFNSVDEALSEFRKIFKSKTGNDWSCLNTFQKKPKKYSLVQNETNPERMLKYQEKVLKPFNLIDAPKSHLPKPLQDIMEAFTNVSGITSACDGLHHSFMPLGLISKENIEKAEVILSGIRLILNKEDVRNLKSGPDVEEDFQRVAELSNQYYMLLPPANYSFEKIRPLNSIDEVEKCEKEIYNITELNYTVKMLIAAQSKITEINPLDYCYKALDCHLELMSADSAETKLILKYIYNQGDNDHVNVTGIFRVGQLNKTFVGGESTMLWHGTYSAHMIGILRSGLQFDAPHACQTGSAYGKGIYFSWQFNKAMQYSDRGYGKKSFVLLCEISLGKMFYYNYSGERPKTADSVWVRAAKIPNPSEDTYMPYGAKMMVGAPIDDPILKDADYVYSDANHEAVVFDPERVKIRYIVQLN